MKRAVTALLVFSVLSGCANFGKAVAPSGRDVGFIDGPPIRRVVTPYDEALACIGRGVPPSLNFAVGAINDSTGKESYADAGSGKLVTQAAGDMIQTALFSAGVRVVNRRDPSIAATEHNWGIRDIKQMTPADLFITGSINSLDFIPGGGASITLAGIGPRARQNRILVGMDLAMTSTITGEIVANVAIQKQLVGEEIGFAVGRFFDSYLVDVSAGAMVREAINMVMRQMLYYGVYQLLLQALDENANPACSEKLTHTIAEDLLWDDASGRANFRAIVSRIEASRPPSEAEVAAMRSEMTATPPRAPMSDEVRKLANNVTTNAARAITMFDAVVAATTTEAADTAFEKGRLYISIAVRDLRTAADKGLTGPEGDAVATLVEQAIRAGAAAEVAAANLRAAGGNGVASGVAPAAEAAPSAPPDVADPTGRRPE